MKIYGKYMARIWYEQIHAYDNIINTNGQSNYRISFLSTHFYVIMRAGSDYSLFITQYFGILGAWLLGTTQIIHKKEAWPFQGDNEVVGWTDAGGDENLTLKFVWPYKISCIQLV